MLVPIKNKLLGTEEFRVTFTLLSFHQTKMKD